MRISLILVMFLIGCSINNPIRDADNDGIANQVDNCPSVPNEAQEDNNNNGVGDACERYSI